MSEVHYRILASAEELYAAALESVDSDPLWWVEMSAAASAGACTFLINDSETEDELRASARLLRKQAVELAEQARAAWVRDQTHARLNGARRGAGRSSSAGDVEGLIAFMDAAVQRTLGGQI